MARCEFNYLRLLRVFPRMALDQQRRLSLSASSDREVVLSVLERTPFTTLLSLEEHSCTSPNSSSGARWSSPPVLTVRMYHDAKVAEVVTCDQIRNTRPVHPYPNKKMLQRDEKAQWNRFLEEWLTLCLEHASVTEPAPVLVAEPPDK